MRQAPPSLRTARRTRSRELNNCTNGMICNTGTADRFLNSTPIDLPAGPAGSQLLPKPLKSKQFIATAAASCPLLSRNRPFNRKVRCAEATGGARPMLRGSGARYGRWRGSFPASVCHRFCRRAATCSQCWKSSHPRPSRLSRRSIISRVGTSCPAAGRAPRTSPMRVDSGPEVGLRRLVRPS